MNGINKVILIGRICQKPELVTTNNGKQVTNFSIATNENWKNGQGVKQEHTEFHRLTMFGKLAEIAASYCDKGAMIYVEGSIRTNKFTDKNGDEKEVKDVIVNVMQMLSSRTASTDADRQQQYANQQKPEAQPPSFDDFDDDLPF